MGELVAAFGIDWRLLVIQVVNFGVLLFALWYFLYTPVLTMIDERRKKIEAGVRDAEEAHKRLADIDAQKDATIAEARKEASGIVADAKQKATTEGASIKSDAELRAEAIVRDAELRAREEADKARRALQDHIAQSALLAAEKILRNQKTI